MESQEKLEALLSSGKIDQLEYQNLKRAMAPSPTKAQAPTESGSLPWPVWVVIVVLLTETLGDALLLKSQPILIVWIAAKCLSLYGLYSLKRWGFILFIILSAIHAIGFLFVEPLLALKDLVVVTILFASYRHYFSYPFFVFRSGETNSALFLQETLSLKDWARRWKRTKPAFYLRILFLSLFAAPWVCIRFLPLVGEIIHEQGNRLPPLTQVLMHAYSYHGVALLTFHLILMTLLSIFYLMIENKDVRRRYVIVSLAPPLSGALLMLAAVVLPILAP